jgi:hypothetical protein
MQRGEPLDPALVAATLALSRRAERQASRFATIDLRKVEAEKPHLALLGYFASVASALAVAVALWML